MPRGRKPGTSKTGGRQKGTPNKFTLRTREELQALIDTCAAGDPFVTPAGYLVAVLLGKKPANLARMTASIA